jgi:hypothetical protein
LMLLGTAIITIITALFSSLPSIVSYPQDNPPLSWESLQRISRCR